MAARKLSATIFILSLLLLATFTNACGSCQPVTPKPRPKPKPKPNPAPSPKAPPVNCPRDTLKFGACMDVLGMFNVIVGTPPYSKCCAVLEGMVNIEAAACLCTVIKANVLGMDLTVPIAFSALFSACGRTIPPGFQCG